jgi:hypothetical protein
LLQLEQHGDSSVYVMALIVEHDEQDEQQRDGHEGV